MKHVVCYSGGRNLQKDFWLRLSGAFLRDQTDAGETHFVISDVRFTNEADWVKRQGGQIWRIHREGLAGISLHEELIRNSTPLEMMEALREVQRRGMRNEVMA